VTSIKYLDWTPPHASWGPAVALTVADWLDHEAELTEQTDRLRDHDPGIRRVPAARTARSMAVAQAYLGEAS
jgi:hypothetical protein